MKLSFRTCHTTHERSQDQSPARQDPVRDEHGISAQKDGAPQHQKYQFQYQKRETVDDQAGTQ